jgi:DUF4097 and DUF4098 domain-containing protein YvlB
MIVCMACRRSSLFAVTTLVLLASAGCVQHGGALQGRASDEWTRSYTLAAGGEFQIVGAVGAIAVEAGAGPTVEVKAERVARARTEDSARQIPSRIRISEDVASDKVVLRTEGLGGVVIGIEVEVNYHVTVPRSTRLRLHTAGGDISIANLDGAVVASATNGAIVARGVAGGFEARSTNGNITVDVSAVSRAPIDLRAVNGQISLTLPVSANANIDASCTNGSIELVDLPLELTGEQSRRRTRGRLNEGGAPVELSTTNGDIHIRGAAGAPKTP